MSTAESLAIVENLDTTSNLKCLWNERFFNKAKELKFPIIPFTAANCLEDNRPPPTKHLRIAIASIIQMLKNKSGDLSV